MNRRRLLVVLAAIVAVALAGCSSGGGTTTPLESTGPSGTTTAVDYRPTADQARTDTSTPTPTSTPTATPTVEASAAEIRQVAVATSRNVSTYRSSVTGKQIDRSNNVERTVRLNNTRYVDRADQELRRDIRQQVLGQTIRVEDYVVDGVNYNRRQANVRRFDAEWIRIDVSDNVSEVLDTFDLLENYRKALGNATVSVAGARRVDGRTLRVLRADVNETAFEEILGGTNRTTITETELTYYVGHSQGRIRRIDVLLNQTVSGQRTIERTIDTTIRFDYGSVSITLPDAAENAVEIGDGNGSTDDESDGGRTDNATDGDEGDDESTTTAAGIAVRNGTLAVDPDTTFHWLETVLETNVTDPEAVIVEEPSPPAGGTDSGSDRRTLAGLLGLEAASMRGTNVSLGSYEVPPGWIAEVRVGGLGNVYLRSSPAMPTEVVRLLTTHEFVHYVQLQNDRFTLVNRATDGTTDGRYAARATTEGAAVVATDAVLDRYVPGGPRNSELYAGVADAVPPGSANAYGNGRYVNGAAYVAGRVDDPANLSRVYEHPPTTSEQVLHGVAPGVEPPANLSVTVATDGEYVVAGTDRKGEAYVRHALANGVDWDRARAAAAGWGNDTVRTLQPAGGGNLSYVWIQRWDDADEASEFAAAAADYLDARGATENGTATLNGVPATLRTPGDRTTALVIGPEPLQDRTSVAVEGQRVVVETG